MFVIKLPTLQYECFVTLFACISLLYHAKYTFCAVTLMISPFILLYYIVKIILYILLVKMNFRDRKCWKFQFFSLYFVANNHIVSANRF